VASTQVEGAALRGQLQRLGLYRASGHEHFSGSLVIPVIGSAGEITDSLAAALGLQSVGKLEYALAEHSDRWSAAGQPRIIERRAPNSIPREFQVSADASLCQRGF
jgi:hypothetical protein